ncbi:MAG: hypothetical protein ChlgKO_11500 [Chlamydiales bacterium]
MDDQFKEIDTKEIELPDTIFARDIDNNVFQSIAARCLVDIEGVAFVEGNLLDSLLGREGERVKGITVNQDQKSHSVNIRIEVNVAYGVCIPEKADEIQSSIATEITKLTGLHVGSVHVVFKNLIPLLPEIKEEAHKEEEPEALLEDEEIEV